MPACEKCWSDAYMRMIGDTSKSQSEHYADILREREDNPCSEEEQKFGRKEDRSED